GVQDALHGKSDRARVAAGVRAGVHEPIRGHPFGDRFALERVEQPLRRTSRRAGSLQRAEHRPEARLGQGDSTDVPRLRRRRGGTDDGHVTLSAGESTPWRVLVVGEKPGDLLERNYLLLNLNRPCALTDVSWIKPGKAMRDGALTTASAKAIVDLAPKLGVDYVGFDDRWFGKDAAGDATHVRAPNLDIKEVAAYG